MEYSKLVIGDNYVTGLRYELIGDDDGTAMFSSEDTRGAVFFYFCFDGIRPALAKVDIADEKSAQNGVLKIRNETYRKVTEVLILDRGEAFKFDFRNQIEMTVFGKSVTKIAVSAGHKVSGDRIEIVKPVVTFVERDSAGEAYGTYVDLIRLDLEPVALHTKSMSNNRQRPR